MKKVNYNSAKPWVYKAMREQQLGNTTIMLLKLTTLGTQYMMSTAPTAELRILNHFPGYVLLIFHGDSGRGGTVKYINHLPENNDTGGMIMI